MSPTSTLAKRKEGVESEDESLNSLMREGREERGEGGCYKTLFLTIWTDS